MSTAIQCGPEAPPAAYVFFFCCVGDSGSGPARFQKVGPGVEGRGIRPVCDMKNWGWLGIPVQKR